MASAQCIAKCIAILSEAFPHRELSEYTVPTYSLALDEIDDATLELATKRAIKRCRFFPSPAELRDLVGANASDSIDLEPILERIRGLFSYLPNSGDQPPRVDAVRRELGDAIAAAYGTLGGGERLFSANETTRAIARREFADELRAIARTQPAALQLPPASARALPAVEIYGEPQRDHNPSTLRRLLAT